MPGGALDLFENRAAFVTEALPLPAPCCVRGAGPGVSSWLGRLPAHPCSPLACVVGPEVRPPASLPSPTHAHSLLVPFLEVIPGEQGVLTVIRTGLPQQGTNQGNRKAVCLNYTQKMFPAAGCKTCELMKQKSRPGINPPPLLRFSQLGRGCLHPRPCLLIQAQPGSNKKTLSGD